MTARSRPAKDFIVRGAFSFEGPVLAWLFADTPMKHLDWEQPLDSTWAVAVHRDRPEYYGAISIVASRPIGRLELLKLAPGLPYKRKALVVRDLITYGLFICQQLGCQAVAGASEQPLVPTFGRTLEKRFNAVRCGEFTGYVVRLSHAK